MLPLIPRLRRMARSVFLRGKTEAELDAELQDHLHQEIDSGIRAGLSPEEAGFAARRLMGPISLHKDECRDAWGTRVIESTLRDLRHAARMLRRAPLFTATAILTLALGIGANTTVFTFVENILLRSLPVRAPERLAFLNWGDMLNMSYPTYLDFRDQNTVFSSLLAYRYNPVSMSVQTRENFRVWGYEATGNYFPTLGIQPALGRFFGPAEDAKPGGNPVVVISCRYWKTRFASDQDVVGKVVKMNGYPFTIIGVAPASFSGTELIVSADYWVPMSMASQIEPGSDWLHSRSAQNIWVMGRLKPGTTNAQAAANLDQIAHQLARAYPNDRIETAKFRLSRPGLIGQFFRGALTSFGIVLMGVAGVGLLLACMNLASMLLARASDRHREVGIRLALGASQLQLLRQLMTETLLISVGGGLLGLLIAFTACRLFSAWHLDLDIPITTKLQPDAVVLWFAAAVALATTLLSGLTPALQAIRTDVMPSLKNEPVAKPFRRWSVRDLLVGGQIALSMILVICSVLVVRSLQRALNMNLGFNPQHVVCVSFDLRLQRYNEESSRRFDAALLRKAAAVPGFQSIGIINNLPLELGGESNQVVSRTDRPIPKPSEWRAAIVYSVSPGYFHAAGTRLLAGRDVNDHDQPNTPPVVIVNEALAHVYFENENPLGQHIRFSTDPADKGAEIVGLVETGKYESVGEDPHAVFFRPISQTGTASTTLIARTPLPAPQAAELLRKTVLDLDQDLTVFNAGSLQDRLALPLFPARAAAIVLGIFGVLANVLAATGLFAMVAYSVSRRTREIGIRMALGAKPSQVLSSVLARTLVLVTSGIVIGTLITLTAARFLSAILYGVSPRDPIAYITAILLLTLVGVLACWNPAARAIRIDPARTLREE